jgi:hypothetical protein
LKELLEFTRDEMKKRPTTSKAGKVEKGKKSSKLGDVKKSIEELRVLIAEVATYKSALTAPEGSGPHTNTPTTAFDSLTIKAQSPNAISAGSNITPPSGTPTSGTPTGLDPELEGDNIDSFEGVTGARIGVGGLPGETNPPTIGGEEETEETPMVNQ